MELKGKKFVVIGGLSPLSIASNIFIITAI